MVVDVPYVVRFNHIDSEFVSSDDLFVDIVSALVELPDDFLPASVRILNVAEFAVEEIERDHDCFRFRSENGDSILAHKFYKFMEGFPG